MVIRDAKVKPVPPLHIACRDRDVDTVLRLISLDDAGAVREGSVDVNEKDDGSGWTPLHVRNTPHYCLFVLTPSPLAVRLRIRRHRNCAPRSRPRSIFFL
jgi:hypothetical protein